MTIANGTFEVKLTPVPLAPDRENAMPGVMSIDKHAYAFDYALPGLG